MEINFGSVFDLKVEDVCDKVKNISYFELFTYNMISVIIPTFNESKNISELINQLLILDISYDIEIIIVDDNSGDGTSDIVRKFIRSDKRIRLISRIGRSGLSSAIKEGCLSASGEIVAVMDADGQHVPSYINKALECFKTSEVDIVVGSRFKTGSSIRGLSKSRERGSTLANNLARLSLYGFYNDLSDFMSGFFVFKRYSCIKFIERIDVNGFKFFYELLSISKGKFKVNEIPILFKERLHGSSKLDLAVVWDFFISLIHSFLMRIFPRRAVSFALVGSIGVLVQLLTIYFLIAVSNLTFEQVLPAGVIVAASSNFAINNMLTFRTQKLIGKSFFFGLIKFLLVSSLPIIANIGITNLIYTQLSVNTFISQIVGILVVFIWNYAASSKVVWNN